MRKSVRRLAAVIGVALTPLATVALANPAVSSAQPLDCGNGWWWEIYPAGIAIARCSEVLDACNEVSERVALHQHLARVVPWLA